MSDQQCGNCKFSATADVYWIQCRRYPPRSSQDMFNSGFPFVRESNVCGEWQPAQTPPDQSKAETHGR